MDGYTFFENFATFPSFTQDCSHSPAWSHEPEVQHMQKVNTIPAGGGGPLAAPPSQRWIPTEQTRCKSRSHCHQSARCPSAGCRLPPKAPAPASQTSWFSRGRKQTGGTACTQMPTSPRLTHKHVYQWKALVSKAELQWLLCMQKYERLYCTSPKRVFWRYC